MNGAEVSYTGSATDRLLDVLRDTYDCKSVKCGCKEGECGACAVLIDGVLTNSCCVAMGAVDGCEVMSMEGYRETARFAVLDKAFASVSAVQCGFCMFYFCLCGILDALENERNLYPHTMEEILHAAEIVGMQNQTAFYARLLVE